MLVAEVVVAADVGAVAGAKGVMLAPTLEDDRPPTMRDGGIADGAEEAITETDGGAGIAKILCNS